MPSRLLKDLEPVTREMVNRLMSKMVEIGHPVRCTCTYRSIAEQDQLFAQVPRVTKARGGQSPHNYRMAADFIFVTGGYDGPWELFGGAAREVGLVWGGDWVKFPDRPHVERRDWRKLI